MTEHQAFALEAADVLDGMAARAEGMLGAIPAIVRPERIERHNAVYISEARRFRRLARAVRLCAENNSDEGVDERDNAP